MFGFKKKQTANVVDLDARRQRRSYTSMMLDQLAAVRGGQSAAAEATATVQACVNLWESGLGMARVSGAPVTAENLSLAARWLALEGNALFLLDGSDWLPVADWDVKTDGTRPVAYSLSLPDSGGPTRYTALAGEVLHFKIGRRLREPWLGSSPLSRCPLSGELLAAVEAGLGGVFGNAPLGSMIVTTPEDPAGENAELGSSFRGKHGRVLLRETVAVVAAGGPAPQQDWKPQDLTPDLSDSGLVESWEPARGGIMAAFGVLPALLDPQASAQAVREASRHLAQWQLQPIAVSMAQEISTKVGADATLDVVEAAQAYDAAGKARAFKTLVDALAAAKEAGISPADLAGLQGMGSGGMVDP